LNCCSLGSHVGTDEDFFWATGHADPDYQWDPYPCYGNFNGQCGAGNFFSHAAAEAERRFGV